MSDESQQAISQDAAERAAKVERLRLEIASGQYPADPADTARGIVDEALSESTMNQAAPLIKPLP